MEGTNTYRRRNKHRSKPRQQRLSVRALRLWRYPFWTASQPASEAAKEQLEQKGNTVFKIVRLSKRSEAGSFEDSSRH